MGVHSIESIERRTTVIIHQRLGEDTARVVIGYLKKGKGRTNHAELDSFQYPLEGYKCLGGIGNHIISRNILQFLVSYDSFSRVRH